MNAASAKARVMKTAKKYQSFHTFHIFVLIRNKTIKVPINIAAKMYMNDVDCSMTGLSILYGKGCHETTPVASVVLWSMYLFVINSPTTCATKKMATSRTVIFTVCFIIIHFLALFLKLLNKYLYLAHY